MQRDAVIGREGDDAGRRNPAGRDDAEDLAGAAEIHARGRDDGCRPRTCRPGIHGADHDRRSGAGKACRDVADAVREFLQRRQPFGSTRHEVEQRREVTEIAVDEADRGDRVGGRLAGQPEHAIILRRHHPSRPGPDIGVVAPHPRHAAEAMAGVDRQQRAPPLQAFFILDRGVEPGRLGGAAPVLPDDRRRQRLAVGADEDMGIDLRADADALQPAEIEIPLEPAQRPDDALDPVAGILLDDAAGRPRRRIGLGEAVELAAGGRQQQRLDGGGADIDADDRVLNHPGLPSSRTESPRGRPRPAGTCIDANLPADQVGSNHGAVGAVE